MLEIGQFVQTVEIVTSERVETFASVSGDMNPIHLDETYAKSSLFGQRIAHGLFVASFISSAIANKLPGPGSIYLKQDLNFKKPVYIGDTIITKVEVINVLPKGFVELNTTCSKENGEVVIVGQALVKITHKESDS